MIIEKILKREGDKALVEMQGISSEPKPVGYLAGSSFYCRDKGETYTFDGAEWVLTSTKMGGGVSGPKMPKDCAFYITEYGDVDIYEQQSDDEIMLVSTLKNVPIKAKNVGEGLRIASQTMSTAMQNLSLNPYIPFTVREYDLNGLTTIPALVFMYTQLENIKGLEKVVTLESGCFSDSTYVGKEDVINFPAVENWSCPDYVKESLYGGSNDELPCSCFANFKGYGKTLKFPKLKSVGPFMFDYCYADTLDFGELETIEAGGFMYHMVNKIIIRTPKMCQISQQYGFTESYSSVDSITVQVPANLLAQYQADENWNRYRRFSGVTFEAIAE